jgi:hypothetical protein
MAFILLVVAFTMVFAASPIDDDPYAIIRPADGTGILKTFFNAVLKNLFFNSHFKTKITICSKIKITAHILYFR